MKPNAFTVAASVAWAALAISTATPAGAFAITTQSGEYASCSASYSTHSQGFCFDPIERHYLWHTNYTQQIRFVTTACNSGGCNPDPGTVYVDAVYGTGRKTVTSPEQCSTTYNIYLLGTCAC